MKITIELSENQVNGIKEYIKDTEGIEKPTKNHIKDEIYGIIQTSFQSSDSVLANYIKIEVEKI
jgi:hypothetical protein